jgi:hypothetical protein
MVKKLLVTLAVEELTAKRYWLVSPLIAWIENLAHGEVEPTPTLPPMKVAAIPPPACWTARAGYPTAVLEAKRPAWAHSAVVVAFVLMP